MTIYQRAKAERERQRLEEERRLAEAEAARQAEAAAAAARTMKTEQDLQAAVSAETLAQRAGADAVSAQKAAGAKAADMSRTRGDLGAVGSLRTFWDFKELDRATVDLEALRPYLPQDALEQAVRGYTRANFRPGHPGIQIRGVVIFENTHTRVA